MGEGDRVALALPAGITFVVALHAALRLGAAAVPVDLRLGAAERAPMLAGATVLDHASVESIGLSPMETTPGAERAGGPVRAGETATLIHTSGTTGAPRPVTLTHANWAAHAAASGAALGHPPGERWLCCLPLSHVGGLGILVRAAVHATTVVLHERFDAAAVAGALRDGRITGVSLVPTMLVRLLDAGLARPPTLRCALIGGGPMAPSQLDRARAVGVPVAQTYGLTEACSQVTAERPGEGSGTAGRALPGTEVRIEDGEILVRGPTVAPTSRDRDGWLRTGDLGALDDDGRLTVARRRAEMIVTGGENVAPAEVEAALEAHPAVAEAAAFARPDPEWGERIAAAVVLRRGATATPADLRAHAAARLAGFKVPKEIELRASLPRTASGKVRRGDLR